MKAKAYRNLRLRRWLTALLVLVILVAAGIFGAGSVLPVEQTTVRGAFIKAPIMEVYAALTNYEAAPRWDAGTATARRMADRDGKPVWTLMGPTGKETTLIVEAQEAPVLHQVRVEGNRFFDATWQFQLAPQPEGTFVKLTQTSVIHNPLVRFAAQRFHLLDQGIRHYLKSLGAKFGQPVTVEEMVA